MKKPEREFQLERLTLIRFGVGWIGDNLKEFEKAGARFEVMWMFRWSVNDGPERIESVGDFVNLNKIKKAGDES